MFDGWFEVTSFAASLAEKATAAERLCPICKYTTGEGLLRVGTGSKIFFLPERRCGSGFQKMMLRKIASEP